MEQQLLSKETSSPPYLPPHKGAHNSNQMSKIICKDESKNYIYNTTTIKYGSSFITLVIVLMLKESRLLPDGF